MVDLGARVGVLTVDEAAPTGRVGRVLRDGQHAGVEGPVVRIGGRHPDQFGHPHLADRLGGDGGADVDHLKAPTDRSSRSDEGPGLLAHRAHCPSQQRSAQRSSRAGPRRASRREIGRRRPRRCLRSSGWRGCCSWPWRARVT
ncbi:MAG: hypothetical protein AVDCRST_MAG54-3853 [uncultured Actinomycetospora sp.]|uniref:Uncharacterized protein n=1 Tax=uncultured Actinomycetospora sp. TaxID=1135996 RepID=A0A6J4JPR4_9PSEU|nr:MAG: hypothetical protein AVDCRST_MAG54-3853 [uncultured Actinomycetospora sp.]